MTAAETESKAIRRISGRRGDPDTRAEDAEKLATVDGDDRKILRALFEGLWDEDQTVREACESALDERFRSTDTEGRHLIVETLVTRLTGDHDPPQEVVSLLFRIVGWVRSHDTEESHLFTTILAEAERARGGGTYPPAVRRAFKSLYNRPSADDSRSAQIVSQFDRRRAIDQLRSETAPPAEIEDALRKLGDGSLDETEPEALLYHLIPLRVSHNYQVMDKVLKNLRSWTEELPQDDKFELADSVEALKEYRRGRREQLPGRLRNEIGLSELAVDALVEDIDRLRELPEYERLVDPLLEVLRGVDGVRQNVEAVAAVAQVEEGITRERAVSLLCDLLVGLDGATAHNETLLRRAYDEPTEEADETAREVLESLATGAEVEEKQVRVAVRALVQSRPPDLEERLEALMEGRPADDPVTKTILETVADEAILDATEPVVDLFEHLLESDGDVDDSDLDHKKGATEAIETLEALGHDTARRALQDGMEEGSEEISEQSRDALTRSGYYGWVRALDTEERARSLASRSDSVGESRQRLEERRRECRREYKRLEIQLREQVFEGDQILRRGLLDVTEQRIDSIGTLTDLYEEDRRVERLLQQAEAFHPRLGQYLNRLPLGDDVREGMEEEIATINQDLEYAERLVAGNGDRVTEIERQLESLNTGASTETSSGTDTSDADAALSQELREMERNSLTELRERYRTASQQREERVTTLRSRFDREQEQFRNAAPNGHPGVNDIQAAIDAAQSRANRIETLTSRREREWEQVRDALDSRDRELSDLLDRIQETITELENVQSQINELNREISELRVERQHLTQRVREDEEAYERIERRARDKVEYLSERAVDRDSFYTHRQVYSNFIRRYYEVQLDIASQKRFQEEHGEMLEAIEQELAGHFEFE